VGSTDSALRGISVFERGWLSSNNVLLHDDAAGGVLVDTSHSLHAEQTVALVRHALGGQPLARIVNTHLHSDHCGGNARLQREFGVPLAIPPGLWDAVQRWDDVALTYRPTGQRCEPFHADSIIRAGDTLEAGGRRWSVLAAPGHDPHSVILFDAGEGVLVSADALWESGFGVVFPELEGEAGFDEVDATLDLIAGLPVRIVIPGHGAPFADVAGALQRARSRLDAFRADPARHARHAIKVLIKYHLLEEQREALPAFEAWLDTMDLARSAWESIGRPDGTLLAWAHGLVGELCTSGALDRRDGMLLNR
jgi:glyoxylase-like metal-dependent hydrolase (beta-lactamase superfamily II)